MHCNAMRKIYFFREHQQEAKRCNLIKLYDGILAEIINSADVFRFAPSYKKDEIFPLKGIKTATHFVTSTPTSMLTYLGVPRLSMSVTIVFAFIGSKVPHDVLGRKSETLDVEF